METLGLRIFQLRRQTRTTQAVLAARAGIPQASLSRIERGVQDMTVSTLIRICSALDTSPAKIFEERLAEAPFHWTRSALERIGRSVTGSPEKLRKGEKEIVNLLKDEIHGLRKRLSSKQVYQSWYELRQRLSGKEIQALINRVRDAQQRQL